MKQHEAVIQTLERLGGIATLAQLNNEVLKIPDCDWKTKTPFASIRRIVQLRPEIYKIKPGLYGLVRSKSKLEARGILASTETNQRPQEIIASDHSYYQGLLLTLGNLKHYGTFAPNQDKAKPFLEKQLKDVRTLGNLPPYSYAPLVKRSSTIDVIWLNQREMPHSFFEVESSTDIQNSLVKFNDLQDFNVRMFIVAAKARRAEYESKRSRSPFVQIKDRVKFLDFESVVKQYETALVYRDLEVII